MFESGTFVNMQYLVTVHRLLTRAIADLENDLFVQRKQRPYNIPYIMVLEKRLTTLLINKQHIKDRLDKVDGCF